jgi:multiple sugar transport system substrate-binding protein
MERIVEKFNAEHTDVRIELTQGQWTDYYAQLYSAVIAGNAPQIGVVHSTQLPRMAVALTPLVDSPAGNLLGGRGHPR